MPGLVSAALPGFGATFRPLMVASRLWKRLNRSETLAGMLVGAATLVVWKQYADSGIHEMVPGAFTASTVIVVVGLLKRAPTARMHSMHRQVRPILHQQGF